MGSGRWEECGWDRWGVRSVVGVGRVGGVSGWGAGCEVYGWSRRNGSVEDRDWWAGEVGG